MIDKPTILLSTESGSNPAHKQLESDLLDAFTRRTEAQVTVVPSLNNLPSEGTVLRHLQSLSGDLLVFSWLYSRAAYWTLFAGGVKGQQGIIPSEKDSVEDAVKAKDANDPTVGTSHLSEKLPDRTIWCFSLQSHNQMEPFLEQMAPLVPGLIVSPLSDTAASSKPALAQRQEETIRSRWYPVIDFARCTDCLECLDFCLFGVYGLDESESILVEQPDACRPGCPACSRICPAGAIMFPRHKDPAISGDPTVSPNELKLDLSQIFGGASPEQQAATERTRALADREAGQPQEKSSSEASQSLDQETHKALDHLVDDLDDLNL